MEANVAACDFITLPNSLPSSIGPTSISCLNGHMAVCSPSGPCTRASLRLVPSIRVYMRPLGGSLLLGGGVFDCLPAVQVFTSLLIHS